MNRLTNISTNYSLFLVVAGTFLACLTKVPISNSEKIPHQKILGYWQTGHNELLNNARGAYIFKDQNDKPWVARVVYSEEKEIFEIDSSKKPSPIFFHSLIDDSTSHEFFSIGLTIDEKQVYLTGRYSFDYHQNMDKTNQLEMNFQSINLEFLLDWANNPEFSTSQEYAEFLEQNVNKKTLYNVNETFQKRKSLEGFDPVLSDG